MIILDIYTRGDKSPSECLGILSSPLPITIMPTERSMSA